MSDFVKFSNWMCNHFEDEDGQFELSRFRMALEMRKRKTKDLDEADFIDQVSGYIEDPGFWNAIGYLDELPLPK